MERLDQEFKNIFKLDGMVEKMKAMVETEDQESLEQFKIEVDRFKNINHYEIDNLRDKLKDKPRIQEMIEKVDINIKDFMKQSQDQFRELHQSIQQKMEDLVGDLNHQIENKNMKILMKISSNKVGMYNDIWVNEDKDQLSDEVEFYQTEFKRNMVFHNYFEMQTEYIVIETVIGNKILHTKLMKPSREPLG